MAETTETTATGVADTTKAEETAVKTFTQEEVNGIVTKQSKSAVE